MARFTSHVMSLLICLVSVGLLFGQEPGASTPSLSESSAIVSGTDADSVLSNSSAFRSFAGGVDRNELMFRQDDDIGLDARFMLPELHDRLLLLSADLSKIFTGPDFEGRNFRLVVDLAWFDRSRWETEQWKEHIAGSFGLTLPQQGVDESAESFQSRLDEYWRITRDEFFSHHEGRGVNLIVWDIAAGQPVSSEEQKVLPALYNYISEHRAKFHLDYVQLRGDKEAEPKKFYHVHVSIKQPSYPVLSAGNASLNQTEAEGIAQQYLDSVVDYTDIDSLDAIAFQFPYTDPGRIAYSVRYQLLHNEGQAFLDEVAAEASLPLERIEKCESLIEQYHSFIKTYPNRIGTRIAIIDLLELCRKLNEPAAYVDFIDYYPATTEAQIAIACLHQKEFDLLFETSFDDLTEEELGVLVPDEDRLGLEESEISRLAEIRFLRQKTEDFDRFLFLYPMSEHWNTVSLIARKLFSRVERLQYGDQTIIEKLKRANTIATIGDLALDEYQKMPISSESDSETGDANLIYQNIGETRYYLNLAAQVEFVLAENYQTTGAFHDFYRAKLKVELLIKLDKISSQIEEIQNQISQGHAELIATLKEEFSSTRQTLKRGFEYLGQVQTANFDRLNNQLAINFGRLSNEMGQLHNDLVSIHGRLGQVVDELGNVNASVIEVRKSINRTNKKLDQVVQTQKEIKNQITEIDKTVTKGFENVSNQIKKINNEIKNNNPKNFLEEMIVCGSPFPKSVTMKGIKAGRRLVSSAKKAGGKISSGFKKAKKRFGF